MWPESDTRVRQSKLALETRIAIPIENEKENEEE